MLKLDNKTIIKVAAPIMVGTFVQNIVMITDAILVNKLGTIAFNAANNAGLLYVVFFMLCKGLADGTQIQIAKEYGLKQPAAINLTINHSFVTQIVLSLLLMGILFISLPLFTNYFVKNEEIGLTMSSFLSYRMWGLIFASIQVSAMAFFIGIGKTRIIMIATLLLSALNVFLDFGFIYGNFGFPEMGVDGAGLASTISEAVTALFLVSILIRSRHIEGFEYTILKKINTAKIKQILKLSYPLMAAGFLSILTWYIFFSLIEQRSAFDLEVSHVVRNLFFISFIPIFGFAATTRTYVSYYHAQGNHKVTKQAIKKLISLGVVSYVIFFHGALLYPKAMLGIITNSEAVIDEGANVLRLVFGSMLLFAIISVFYQTVAAIGKTFQSLLIEIISIIIYLIFAYLFIVYWQTELLAVWTVEYLYFGVTGLLSVSYLLYFQKKLVQKNG